VDQPGTLLDQSLDDPIGSIGRGADPGRCARPEHHARSPLLEVDRWDDLHASGTLAGE
jgi:hypothetical protein